MEDAVVAHLPGHTLDPAGDQVFDVTGATLGFDLEVAIQANARTMVMFEEKQVTGTASPTGLKAYIFDVAGGERTLTNRIVFTAPESAWEEGTVSFYNYSPCLGGEGCGEQFPQRITWTLRNMAGPGPTLEPDSKDSPGPPILLLVALIASAMLMRRGSPHRKA